MLYSLYYISGPKDFILMSICDNITGGSDFKYKHGMFPKLGNIFCLKYSYHYQRKEVGTAGVGYQIKLTQDGRSRNKNQDLLPGRKDRSRLGALGQKKNMAPAGDLLHLPFQSLSSGRLGKLSIKVATKRYTSYSSALFN